MTRSPWRALAVIGLLLLGGAGGAHAEARPPQDGWSSAALYNLANAYARAGKNGLAVLNYERAGLISPGDPDIEANLLLVRRSMGLPAEPRTRLSRAVGAVDPTPASWIGVAGWLLVVAALLGGRLHAARPVARGAAVIVGIALIGFTVASGLTFWPRLHEAIVIAGTAPVRVSPAPMGEALFTLKEAEAVRIDGEHEGFVLVHASAGRTGWVWHADLVPVVPVLSGKWTSAF
ncbi:MAG TPA: hypothetical protein VGL87_11365 [Steroidobacteraceae bacterium]